MSVPSINAFVACQACHADKTYPDVANAPSLEVINPVDHESQFKGLYSYITKDRYLTKSLKASFGDGANPVSITLRMRNISGDSDSSHSTTK